MKLQDSKFLQKVHLAIRFYVFFACFVLYFTPFLVASQTNNEKSSYALMNFLIGEDTIVNNSMLKSIKYKIQSEKITSADSVKIVESIKRKKLKLYSKTQNKRIIQVLRKSLIEKNWNIFNYLEIDYVERIIKKIPPVLLLQKSLINPKIETIDSITVNSKGFHSFSSSLKIKRNRYLIYHSRCNSSLNSFEELVIYKVLENGKYEIENRILISIS